ncbi:hypothetical protein ENUP19_0325G0009 [Entamoeba nuttalli]|uniref:Plexin repeat-containing protein n=2 Tax=Entamoeba nuttalli TaxID=412467 RepID=K2HY99_ENTNP|nr:plexin repeat-containing protein [Entamoeba nuttalli P19]EKE41350.1 plexin repeat-containing protein [Entamoeba nuttalli P19]|eukprot:XP_008856313.1 plexin repeat-containing protein [Entamoeba nuttalli P19]
MRYYLLFLSLIFSYVKSQSNEECNRIKNCYECTIIGCEWCNNQCSLTFSDCSPSINQPSKCVDCSLKTNCMTCANSGCYWCITSNECQAIPTCVKNTITSPGKCPSSSSFSSQNTNIISLTIIFTLVVVIILGYSIFICFKIRHPTRQQFIPGMLSPYPPPPVDNEAIVQSDLNIQLVKRQNEEE